MLTLILGRGKSGKTTMLLERVANCAAAGMSSRVLIVPEQLSHQTERALSALCGDGISFTSEVLSFTRLSARLCALYGGGARQVLDGAGRLLTARMALSAVSSRLKVFGSAALKPDFLESVVNMIDELKSYNVSPERLMEASRASVGQFAQKLQELSEILAAYNAVAGRGKCDPRDRLTLLREQLLEEQYAETRYFFVDGFTDFSAQELGVLDALLRRGSGLTVTLPWQEGEDLFASGESTLARLLGMARDAGVEEEIVHAGYQRDLPNGLTYLERNLFSASSAPLPEEARGVCLVEAPDLLTECRRCASELRRMAEQGLRWREMAVAVSDPGSYGPVMEAVCTEYGIPLFTGVKTPVTAFPAAAFLLLALEAATEGMSQESVTAWLRTGYAGVTPDQCDALENYAYVWNIRGQRWYGDWTEHPEGYDGRFTDEIYAQLEELNHVRSRAVEPLMHLSSGLKTAGNVQGQMMAVYRFLEETELFRQVQEQVSQRTDAGEIEAAQETAQLWNTLMACLQQTADVAGETSLSSGDLAKLLRMVLGTYEVGTIPAVLDAVGFGDISSVRGTEPEVLMVLGANNGRLPGSPASGSLLSEREREALQNLDIQLAPDGSRAMERQLLEIYAAFTAPTKELIVSWHTGSGDSALQPSYLVERIRTLLPAVPVRTVTEDPTEAMTVEALTELYLSSEETGDRLTMEAVRRTAQQVPELMDAITGAKAAALRRELNVTNLLSKKLFGSPVALTASRLDELGNCPLSFFLYYGLKARERKPASFDAAEYGTFLHHILEKTVEEVTVRNLPLPLSDGESAALVDKHMGPYLESRMQNAGDLSARERYLYMRNSREARLVLADISKELAMSEFRPCAYELQFGDGKELGPLTVYSRLGEGHLDGTVDRVDLWHSPEGDYYRIVDYKSGHKTFDYTELSGGVGMQLFLYMFALRSRQIPGASGSIIPAGAMYLPARQGFVAADSPMQENEAEKLHHTKGPKRTGLLLKNQLVLSAMETEQPGYYLPVGAKKKDNPLGDYVISGEQMDLLEGFIQRQMQLALERIYSGSFPAEPFYRGRSHDPCGWCKYQDVCQTDTDYRREYYHPSLKAEDFWSRIGGKQDG